MIVRVFIVSSAEILKREDQIGRLFREASYSMTLCPYTQWHKCDSHSLLIDKASSHEDACLGLSVPLASAKTYAL